MRVGEASELAALLPRSGKHAAELDLQQIRDRAGDVHERIVPACRSCVRGDRCGQRRERCARLERSHTLRRLIAIRECKEVAQRARCARHSCLRSSLISRPKFLRFLSTSSCCVPPSTVGLNRTATRVAGRASRRIPWLPRSRSARTRTADSSAAFGSTFATSGGSGAFFDPLPRRRATSPTTPVRCNAPSGPAHVIRSRATLSASGVPELHQAAGRLALREHRAARLQREPLLDEPRDQPGGLEKAHPRRRS